MTYITQQRHLFVLVVVSMNSDPIILVCMFEISGVGLWPCDWVTWRPCGLGLGDVRLKGWSYGWVVWWCSIVEHLFSVRWCGQVSGQKDDRTSWCSRKSPSLPYFPWGKGTRNGGGNTSEERKSAFISMESRANVIPSGEKHIFCMLCVDVAQLLAMTNQS